VLPARTVLESSAIAKVRRRHRRTSLHLWPVDPRARGAAVAVVQHIAKVLSYERLATRQARDSSSRSTQPSGPAGSGAQRTGAHMRCAAAALRRTTLLGAWLLAAAAAVQACTVFEFNGSGFAGVPRLAPAASKGAARLAAAHLSD